MKKVVLGFLIGAGLSVAIPAQAQDTGTPVSYTERVPEEDSEQEVLFRRAADWVENHFTYAPKKVISSDAAKGELRAEGTVQVKLTSTSGKQQEQPVRFEFIFHTLASGYDYSVGQLRVVPDGKKPEESVPFDAYVAQLAADRTNTRTRNDRRITAQATSLVSEISISFRSYMNSRPAAGAIE
ncbi:DUF4468 domain-containing protein [Hymenobacter psychrotolerans]|uniref:DUF4468 domain-containing protein n=1 Tax=Hymenobacter psychrotolerans DSM 18569 TaxID=1121959 RepID=A0A1M7C196_9BACT|nr:DUF4468 domain-containing protein [Hymenobacter psychrotolerans]SHL60609.1 protein of unknown function [Hymenobacter psychrotolerans DSM 18569]